MSDIPSADELARDAIDMHIHPLADGVFSAPAAMEYVQRMADAGMAGVLLKPHYVETTLTATLVDDLVSDFRTFGGLIMERSAGGIDPQVVTDQIRNGAKKFWMPLMTQNFWDMQLSHPRGYMGREEMAKAEPVYGPFWEYLDDEGEIRDGIREDLYDVLEVIADADVIFDTGHASAEESMALVAAANEVGVEKIVVDHPLAITKQATIDQQVEMAKMGAYMEQSWAKIQPSGGGVDASRYAEAVEAVGAEHTVLVTDYAGGDHPPPDEAMRDYITTMRKEGIPDADIELMIKDNPRALLGL